MNLFITILAVLLIADALLSWANMDKVQPFIKKYLPNVDIHGILLFEGILGFVVLALKYFTGTLI